MFQIDIEPNIANDSIVTVSDRADFTISAPASHNYPQRITITVRNTSGGNLGKVTWNPDYLMSSWVSPANAFNRSVDFRLSVATGKWTEVGRTPSDVPN
jgi:hypothetical protein